MTSVSTPTIEGASPEQRQLLHEILSGLGGTALSRIVVRPHEPRYEDDIVPDWAAPSARLRVRRAPSSARRAGRPP